MPKHRCLRLLNKHTCAENEASPCTCTQSTLSSLGSGLYSPHWWVCCLDRALPTATGLFAFNERQQHSTFANNIIGKYLSLTTLLLYQRVLLQNNRGIIFWLLYGVVIKLNQNYYFWIIFDYFFDNIYKLI